MSDESAVTVNPLMLAKALRERAGKENAFPNDQMGWMELLDALNTDAAAFREGRPKSIAEARQRWENDPAAALADAMGFVGMAPLGTTTRLAQRANAPKSVAKAFDNITNYNDALALARSGGHIKIDPATGKYIGAPEWVDSPQSLTKVRRDALEAVRGGSWNADWYLRQRELAQALADDPARQSLFARGTAAYSPQAMPKVELPSFVNQHNARVLTGEEVVPRTGSQARNVARAYNVDPSTGAVSYSPADIRLGKKTGPYAQAKDPTVPEQSLYRTANDIWHGRVMGYGDDFSRGFTPQEHGFLTGENLILADNATRAGIPVGAHGQIPHDPRTAQAATWGSTRFNSYKTGDAARYAKELRARERYESNPERWRKRNPGKGAPAVPKPMRTDDELRAAASQGLDSAMPAQRGYLTNEAVPGAGTGHLEGMVGEPFNVRDEYTRQIAAATGRDPTIEALGMFSEKPRPMVGEYTNTAGAIERNPGWVDPVLLSNQPGKGMYGTPAREKEALSTAAQIAAVLRGQEAGAWSRFIPENNRMRVGDMNALAFSGMPEPQAQLLRQFWRDKGLDMIDQGDQGILTMFSNSGPVPNTVKDFERVLQFPDSPVLNKLKRGVLEGDMVPGLAKWTDMGLVPTAPGSGEATSAMLKTIESSGINKLTERLDAGRWKSVAQAYNDIDAAAAASGSKPLREDLMRLRSIVAESGIAGLRDFVKRNGAIGLPALAGLGVLPALQSSPDASD